MILRGKQIVERKPIIGNHIGYIIDGDADTPIAAVLLVVSEDQIYLELPILQDVNEGYLAWKTTIPSQILFVSPDRTFTLTDLSYLGYKGDFLSKLSRITLEVGRLVETRAEYQTFQGLRSELQGLPGWISPDVFSFAREADKDGKTAAIHFKATSTPETSISGVEGLCLYPHFETHIRHSTRNYVMTDTMQVQSYFDEPQEWSKHYQLHRAMQDLISLAYWFPCNLTAVQMAQDADKTLTPDGRELKDSWRKALVPDFGRRARESRIVPMDSDLKPLFYFSDIGVEGVAKWYGEYDDLGKAMWVLSSSLFREGGTVEVRLLQVATALEALGYHLATSNTQRAANFEPTISRVAENTPCSLDKVLGGFKDAKEWAAAFNTAYKGVKHADNPLPAGLDAYERAKEGALLARLWLALHLGADKDKLEDRLHQQHNKR